MLLDSIKKWAKKVSKNSQELFKKKIQKHRKFVKIIVTMKHELYQILGPLRSIWKAPYKYKWRVWHLCHTPSKMGLRKFSRKELHFLLLQPISLLKKIILTLKRVCCIPNASNKARFFAICTKIPSIYIKQCVGPCVRP